MEKINEAQKLVELLIAKTPTSELRNQLTDINILLSSGQFEYTRWFNEVSDMLTQMKSTLNKI